MVRHLRQAGYGVLVGLVFFALVVGLVVPVGVVLGAGELDIGSTANDWASSVGMNGGTYINLTNPVND